MQQTNNITWLFHDADLCPYFTADIFLVNDSGSTAKFPCDEADKLLLELVPCESRRRNPHGYYNGTTPLSPTVLIISLKYSY
jgi:hypothetical protein